VHSNAGNSGWWEAESKVLASVALDRMILPALFSVAGLVARRIRVLREHDSSVTLQFGND
jgi:hypothetical protein